MPTHQLRWIRISFLNLLLVSLAGVILRYKIAFSLPFVDQKFLLHGHSHFAFTGWITHTLMVLLIHHLNRSGNADHFKKYRSYLIANLITAYGMLISFPLQGYGPVAIVFSTLSIFVSYFFAISYWKDLSRTHSQKITKTLFKTALICNTLSSIGPFYLAYMMATKTFDQTYYLSSIYFYLHFQYNGWFMMVILGLVAAKTEFIMGFRPVLKKIAWLFILTCLPTYGLSVLWLPIPTYVYWLVVAAAFAQLYALVEGVRIFYRFRKQINAVFPLPGRNMLLLSAIAFTCKILLQLGSTIPSLSHLSYGFRPIIIGYLHLVLLGFVSLFLIGYLLTEKLVMNHPVLLTGIKIFTSGIILNEILLMIQGLAALNYHSVFLINESLLLAAIVMFSGICLMNWNKKMQN